MLEVDDLHVSYGEVSVLRGVTLQVPERSIVCVMGRNGVGKTTLLNTILGLHKPRSGRVLFNGRDVSRIHGSRRVKAGLGYVPQGRQIFSRLTVEENLKTGLGARHDRARKIPGEIYDYFPVLQKMRSRMGGDLSGGQQQQLAIARALVTDPRVLVLDEPTEGIQPNIIDAIGRILHQLVEEKGMTILIVEQYLDFIREVSHHYYVMNRGAVAASGVTSEMDVSKVHSYLSV